MDDAPTNVDCMLMIKCKIFFPMWQHGVFLGSLQAAKAGNCLHMAVEDDCHSLFFSWQNILHAISIPHMHSSDMVALPLFCDVSFYMLQIDHVAIYLHHPPTAICPCLLVFCAICISFLLEKSSFVLFTRPCKPPFVLVRCCGSTLHRTSAPGPILSEVATQQGYIISVPLNTFCHSVSASHSSWQHQHPPFVFVPLADAYLFRYHQFRRKNPFTLSHHTPW